MATTGSREHQDMRGIHGVSGSGEHRQRSIAMDLKPVATVATRRVALLREEHVEARLQVVGEKRRHLLVHAILPPDIKGNGVGDGPRA
jgi:hypothetical protein